MSIEAMKQALAALEYEASKGNDNAYEKERVALRKAIANEALNRMAENARELGLDYEPPKREWVSLTLDEIWEICKKHDPLQITAYARAIEKALKEKNT